MRKRLEIVAIVVVAKGICADAYAADLSGPVPCRHDGYGYISNPMVPNQEVAEAIYRAVGSALAPGFLKDYPIVVVDDDGDHWSVSQRRDEPPVRLLPSETEAVVVSAGGGQFHMDIDKCSGAISHAAFNR